MADLFDLGVLTLDAAGVRSSFERQGMDYAGTLTVEMPVKLPVSLQGQKVRLDVKIADTFKEYERAAHVFPADLPLYDPWPFTWRVEVSPQSAACDPDRVLFDIFQTFGAVRDMGDFVSVKVYVFALQGVEVSATVYLPRREPERVPPQGAGGPGWKVQVIADKLPRPESLPHPGAGITPPQMHPTYPVEITERPSDLAAVGAFQVQHIPNGLVVRHVATGSVLTLRNLEPWDPTQGFAYAFNHKARRRLKSGRLIYDDFLHLKVTEHIALRVDRPTLAPPVPSTIGQHPLENTFFDPLEWQARIRRHITDRAAWEEDARIEVDLDTDWPADWQFLEELLERWSGEALKAFRNALTDEYRWKHGDLPSKRGMGLRPVPEARFFRLERVEAAAALPPFGAPFRVEKDVAEAEFMGLMGREVMTAQERAAKERESTLFYLEFAMGMVPVLGDAMDLADFAIAAATGCDRHGKPVGALQLALMGVLCIPALGEVFRPLKLRKVLG